VKVVHDPSVRWISDSWVTEDRPDGDPTFSVLRVPFDYAVSYRPGTRFGPQALVAALNELSLYCTDKRVSLANTRFLDLGEVEVVHSLEDTYRNIAHAAASAPPAASPIFLGGDHSITDPIVRGLRERSGGRKIGLVVFDAHFDSRDPVPGKEHSGHWMRTLADVVDYRAVAQLGIGSYLYSEEYMQQAESSGVMVWTPYEIRKAGWPQVLERVVDHVAGAADCVYVSVDIDCVDQAFAPGTSAPNPSGLFPHEVIDAVFELSASVEVAGFDLVEVSPPLDRLESTTRVGASIVLNHVAGVVARRTRLEQRVESSAVEEVV
jgi:agmatinase